MRICLRPFRVNLINSYNSAPVPYNIVQYLMKMGEDVTVHRNDTITVDEARALEFDHLVISPGPGNPDSAGISLDLIKDSAGKKPVLGVCLGHQAICEACGGKIVRARQLMHGKQSEIIIDDNNPIFKGMDKKIKAARYHSLIAERSTLPESIEIIAVEEKGEVMAVRVRDTDVYGLQFHPESILTPNGNVIIKNFLNMKGSHYND